MKQFIKVLKLMPKKTIAVLMVFTLLLNYILPITIAFAQEPSNTGDYGSLEIGGNVQSIQDVSDGTSVTVSFEDGNQVVVTQPNGSLYSSNSGGRYQIYGNGEVTVTAIPANGYSADLRYQGNLLGQTTAKYNLTNNNPVRVDGEFSAGVSGTSVNSTINYAYANDRVEIHINGDYFDTEHAIAGANNNETSGTFNGNINYNYDNSGTVNIDLETLFISRITSVIVNGEEYATKPEFPKTPEQLLEAIDNQVIRYSIQVPYSTTYNISTVTTPNTGEYMTVGNFLWSYQDIDQGTDDYVGHGSFELVKVKYKGVEYTEQQIKDLNKGYMKWEQSEDEGGALLPAGAELTVRLMPDAGYQLTSFTINGGEFEPGEEVGIYTFEVPRGNFHLGAHFTKVNDKVNSNDSDAISSGSIKLSGSESSMASGTARLDVKDIELDESQISNFEDAAGEYKITNYLDISLYNTIYKGKTTDAWDEQVTELDHKATIKLKLADDINGNEVVIVHQKHDGTYEVIETTYDPDTNTISFVTDSFSNYAIASKTNAPRTVISNKANNPLTSDNILTYIGILALSSIGLIIGIVIKKKYKRAN